MAAEIRLTSVPHENHHQIFFFEACSSLKKALLCIEQPTKDELNHFDHLAPLAMESHMSLTHYAKKYKYQLGTRLAAFCLAGYVNNIYDLIEFKIEREEVISFLSDLATVWTNRNHVNSLLLEKLIHCANLISNFGFTKTDTNIHHYGLGIAFHDNATELSLLKKFEEALNNSLTALNFAFSVSINESLAIKLARQCVSLAEQVPDTDLSLILFRYANIACYVSRQDHSKILEAFDAVERLLKYLIIKRDNSKQSQSPDMLSSGIYTLFKANTYLSALLPLFYGTGLLVPQNPIPYDISSIYQPVWNGTWQEFLDLMMQFREIPIYIADSRYKLIEKRDNTQVHFNNWSIEYKKLFQAIPHNGSFLKEKTVKTMLLDLKHELIHVYSLFGRLGTTLNMMRWLLLDLEILLTVNHYNLKDKCVEVLEILTDNLIKSAQPVQLIGTNVISLLYAERSLEIEKRIQIIENVWTPWLEGIALFGETADDPLMDQDIGSPVSGVLWNMIDNESTTEIIGSEKPGEQFYSSRIQLMDEQYSSALEEQGEIKLKACLTRHRAKYLPGYLAVRKILSTWRGKLSDGVLRGDQAFRLLLHVTRFNDFVMLPNLGLPLHEFKNAVIKTHLSWLDHIKNIDATSLISFLSTAKNPVQFMSGWKEGRFFIDPTPTPDPEQYKGVLTQAAECFSSLIGERHYADRIIESPSPLKSLMVACSYALEDISSEPRFFNQSRADLLLSKYSVLPLAHVNSPFWLIANEKLIYCIIRTMEYYDKAGGPSYNATAFHISESDYQYIKERVSNTGKQDLKITRAVILGGYETDISSQHYLVFQFGDWIHIQTAGMLSGKAVPEKAKIILESRFKSNDVEDYKESVNSTDHLCAQRTRDWITENDWSAINISEDTIDISMWADHVAKLADNVLHNTVKNIEEASMELLKFTFSDEETAEKIFKYGLHGIPDHYDLSMQDFFSFIYSSSRSPVAASESMNSLQQKTDRIASGLMHLSSYGWDLIK